MNNGRTDLLLTLPYEEPVGVLLLVVTAMLLFGSFFMAARERSPWFRNLFASAAGSMLFIGMVLGGYVFIKSNIRSFETIYQSFTSEGSISRSKWKRATKTWGGWIDQRELMVDHFVETEALATLPVLDPAAPVLYQTYKTRQQIPQNSIVRFRGKVDLISGKDEDRDGFNGFYARSAFTYDVVNQSDSTVQTEFLFPLQSYQTTYEDIHVQIDGREMESFIAGPDGLHWSIEMAPRQKVVVFVSYSAKGMDGYTYALTENREILDFILTISANDSHVYASVYPSGETIKHEAYVISGNMLISTTKIDRAVAAPAMGVSFVQGALPYAPHDAALRLLRFLPRSSIFLAIALVLTLLISGVSFGLRELMFFQSVFWVHTLVYMLVSLSLEAPKWALLGSAISLTILQYHVLRSIKLARFALIALLAWTFFFMGIYPLSGQKVDTYLINQYDNLVLAGILIYAFSYTLFSRVAGKSSEHKLGKPAKRARLVHWLARFFSLPIILACAAIFIYEVSGNEFSQLIKNDYISYTGLICLVVFPLLAWRWEILGSVLIFLAALILDIYYYLLIQPSLNEFLLFVLVASGAHYSSAILFLLSWRLKKGKHAIPETNLSQ